MQRIDAAQDVHRQIRVVIAEQVSCHVLDGLVERAIVVVAVEKPVELETITSVPQPALAEVVLVMDRLEHLEGVELRAFDATEVLPRHMRHGGPHAAIEPARHRHAHHRERLDRSPKIDRGLAFLQQRRDWCVIVKGIDRVGATASEQAQRLDERLERIEARAEKQLAAGLGELPGVGDSDLLDRFQTVGGEADGAHQQAFLAARRQIRHRCFRGRLQPRNRTEFALERQASALARPTEPFIDERNRPPHLPFIGIARFHI